MTGDIVPCRHHLMAWGWPFSGVGRVMRCGFQLIIEGKNRVLCGLNPVHTERRLQSAERTDKPLTTSVSDELP